MTCAHAAQRSPRRPAAPGRTCTPPGAARPSYHPGPDPVSVLFPGDRAARPSCGPCCAPARTAAAAPPGLFHPDPLPGGRRPGVRAVHPEPALHLRQPRPQPPFPLQRRRQHRDLPVLHLHDRAQPRVGSTQPGSVIRHGLIGHAPQALTPAGAPQIGKPRSGLARPASLPPKLPSPSGSGQGPGPECTRLTSCFATHDVKHA